jgi:hypothetical protein
MEKQTATGFREIKTNTVLETGISLTWLQKPIHTDWRIWSHRHCNPTSAKWHRAHLSIRKSSVKQGQQSYSASKVEMLPVVWAARHFQCYLYGKKFHIRTDHFPNLSAQILAMEPVTRRARLRYRASSGKADPST